MWTCPKCGRAFKRLNQSHYCGKAPKTVKEYINLQPQEIHSHLFDMVSIIKNCIPQVNDRILWSMPYFECNGKSISFSACKKHISFYVGEEAIDHFSIRLNQLNTKKSAIYLPYDKPLDKELIIDITKWCLR